MKLLSRSTLQFSFAAVFAIAFAESVVSEVLVLGENDPSRATSVQIMGDITQADVSKVADAIQRSVAKDPSTGYDLLVKLNSNGGDIDAAIAIGRLLRGRSSLLIVPDGFSCASACVFVLCAGSQRIDGGGKVGIHRPYSVGSADKSVADAASRYRAMAARTREYLAEIGMPARLYEEMMRVPAEQIRWLTTREQEALGVLGIDPGYADAWDSRSAAAYGVSKQVWLQRKARAVRECPMPPASTPGNDPAYVKLFECRHAVYRGTK